MRIRVAQWISALVVTTFASGMAGAAPGDLSYLGTHTWGTSATLIAPTRVVVDAGGNVYLSGIFAGTADLDPTAGVDMRTSFNPNTDVFVTRLNSDGSYAWTRTFGGVAGDSAGPLAVDNAGTVYIAGRFAVTVDFDPGPGTDTRTASCAGPFSCGGSFDDFDIFVTKLTANGDYVSTVTLGGPYAEVISDMALDSNGDLYLTGYFRGTAPVDFDPTAGVDLHTPGGSFGVDDLFVTRLNADGSYGWTRTSDGAGGETSYAMALDGAALYIAGGFSGDADFDPTAGTDARTAAGGADIFVSKFDTSGSYYWTETLGGTGSEGGFAVRVDANHNLFIGGQFEGSVDFDPTAGNTTLTAAGSNDIYLLKLNADRSFGWVQRLGTPSFDALRGFVFDAAGNLLVTGYSTNTPYDFGVGRLFLTGVSSAGAIQFQHQWSNYAFDNNTGLALTPNGDMLTGGDYIGSVDFDPTAGTDFRTRSADGQAFLIRLAFAAQNQPPVAVAGLGQPDPVECTGSVTDVILDGSASSDPDNDPLSYAWSGSFGTASGVSPTVALAPGAHAVTLVVDDGNGHSDTDTIALTVQDTTAPSVDAGADVTLVAVNAGGAPYTVTPVVSDLCGSVSTAIAPTPPQYPIGATVVTVTATDDSDNVATDTVTITVGYQFGGFLPPLQPDGVYKLGRVLPVKIALSFADGSVATGATPTLTLQKLSNGLPDGDPIIPEPTSGADTGNTLRLSGDHYIYNLATSGLGTGTYRLSVDLHDGSAVRTIDIGFK